jgi:hypothetical protein
LDIIAANNLGGRKRDFGRDMLLGKKGSEKMLVTKWQIGDLFFF